MPRQRTEATEAPKGKDININEIGNQGPIEKVSETKFTKTDLELEAFMNEPVEIVVHETAEEGTLPVVVPSVNSVNQPIVRGVPQTIKRKYVEALARCRTTRYTQRTPDPSKPEQIQMVERPVMVYPFDVITDTSKGRAWLKAIMAQP